jgi:hypothetical protein
LLLPRTLRIPLEMRSVPSKSPWLRAASGERRLTNNLASWSAEVKSPLTGTILAAQPCALHAMEPIVLTLQIASLAAIAADGMQQSELALEDLRRRFVRRVWHLNADNASCLLTQAMVESNHNRASGSTPLTSRSTHRTVGQLPVLPASPTTSLIPDDEPAT